MPDASELLSRSEFLRLCGISDSTERRHRKNNLAWPPSLKIGAKVYYRASSLEAWLSQREASRRDDAPNLSSDSNSCCYKDSPQAHTEAGDR